MKRVFISILLGVVVLALVGFVAFEVSPWPYALLIRKAFTEGAEKTSSALEKHVPEGITAVLNEQYDKNDSDAFLDVYFPTAIEQTQDLLPAIVWVHGGGFVSGSKEEVANYCKILASKGYTVVSVNYSIAPEETYPTPVRQTNAALAYLAQHAQRLHIDAAHFILAGDSAGANIVAQLANIHHLPSYAALMNIAPSISGSQLTGLILFCGPYDIHEDALRGEYGKFLEAMLWAYSGSKNFMNDPDFATIKIIEYVTDSYPPVFISAGNADPLLLYSKDMAEALNSHGVQVETLFFPSDYTPALPHEYQFNLDTDAGQLALDRVLTFLSGLDLKPK
ncbi:alpha/beta hydrolase [Catalinimonas sp. 4WD22]|uniref:alpha/beta hydrolase n=1 Tax=Catalinimonas locisalis TaxID=3133978 RepID=UPI00310130AB